MSALVYTFRAADGTALYVGYTYHPKSRIQDHHRKPWWPAVADVQVIEFPDWRDAKATERSTIEALQPIHNIVFTERWQYAPRSAADGTIHNASTYQNHGCRCYTCTTSHAAYQTKRNAQRREWTALHGLPETVRHGSGAYDNWGCRCDTCRTAKTAAARALRDYRRRERAAA